MLAPQVRPTVVLKALGCSRLYHPHSPRAQYSYTCAMPVLQLLLHTFAKSRVPNYWVLGLGSEPREGDWRNVVGCRTTLFARFEQLFSQIQRKVNSPQLKASYDMFKGSGDDLLALQVCLEESEASNVSRQIKQARTAQNRKPRTQEPLQCSNHGSTSFLRTISS